MERNPLQFGMASSGTKIVEELIDSRNKDLWDCLQKKYKFQLEESPEDGFLTYFKENIVVIEIDLKEMNPAAFTHELLHVYMKSKDLKIVWDMKERVEKDPDLLEVFSTSLRVHIGNCLEHIKMLPLFIDRGFSREDFLTDYHKRMMEESELESLGKNYFCEGKVVMESVDRYIGKYFAMKASANPDFDYTSMLAGLRVIDPSLYHILEEFWQAWLKYELGDPEEMYLKSLETFLMNIKFWRRNNKKDPPKENTSGGCYE